MLLNKVIFGSSYQTTVLHEYQAYMRSQILISYATPFSSSEEMTITVKPVLCSHSKIDKTKVLKTNDRLMMAESIAECSLGAFCNTFDLH